MNTEHENAVENVAENIDENAAKAAAPSLATIREGNGYLKVGDVGNSVVTCRKLLNSKGYSCNTTSTTYDATLRDVVKKFQAAMGLTSDGARGQATLAVLEDTQSATGWFSNGTVSITAGKLARMGFGKMVLKPANVAKLNEACNAYALNSKTKVRHFLAQGMAETDKGATFMEYGYKPGVAGTADYAPYYGAGFLQLTWDYEYKDFQTYMKDVKKINDPKIVTPPLYATQYVANTYPFESAGWFWNVYKDLNTKIVSWASLSAEETVKKVTDVVRGTTSGYKTRLTYYEKAKQIFQ